jgi:hypothetical protein
LTPWVIIFSAGSRLIPRHYFFPELNIYRL